MESNPHLFRLLPCKVLVAMDGVVDHGGIEVGPCLHDHLAIEAAHPAVIIGKRCALVGFRGGPQLGDRSVAVHVEVLDLQRCPSDQHAVKAVEGGGDEVCLRAIPAAQGVCALDGPVDVVGDSSPEPGLCPGALQVGEQGCSVVTESQPMSRPCVCAPSRWRRVARGGRVRKRLRRPCRGPDRARRDRQPSYLSRTASYPNHNRGWAWEPGLPAESARLSAGHAPTDADQRWSTSTTAWAKPRGSSCGTL
jgi:hypothetical protein